MTHTFKLSSTLADETRYAIYQYILKENRTVNVLQIASQFAIHPNVARLHLSKLTDSKLLSSRLEKKIHGGRPAKIYEIAKEPIYLSFPKQENDLLLGWLIELVSTGGSETLEKAKRISYQSGLKAVSSTPASFEEKLALLNEVSDSIGYVPKVSEHEGKKIITFQIFNCPYKGLTKLHSEIVCTLHESYLKGLFHVLFCSEELVQIESMLNNCTNCVYQVEVL